MAAKKKYRVAAPYVTMPITDSASGKAQVQGFYGGAVLPDTVEQGDVLERHLRSGMVVEDTSDDAPDASASQPPESPSAPTTGGDEPPPGNASRDAWVEYARTQGADDEELADPSDGGLSRDELRDLYGK